MAYYQTELLKEQAETATQLARLTGEKADGEMYGNVKKRLWAQIYTRSINAFTGTAKKIMEAMPPKPKAGAPKLRMKLDSKKGASFKKSKTQRSGSSMEPADQLVD